MVTLILLLSLNLAPAAHAGRVASVPMDRCQERCVVERSENGQPFVTCSCAKGGGAPRGRRVASHGLRRRAFEAALSPEQNEELSLCEENRGAAKPGFANETELRARASRKTLSLCECAEARTHFPLHRQCVRQRTGELSCSFSPDLAHPSVHQPLRAATTEDYQSCLVGSLNHVRPASCSTRRRCEARMPECGAGEEVSNEADPEACCPIFVCRKASA